MDENGPTQGQQTNVKRMQNRNDRSRSRSSNIRRSALSLRSLRRKQHARVKPPQVIYAHGTQTQSQTKTRWTSMKKASDQVGLSCNANKPNSSRPSHASPSEGAEDDRRRREQNYYMIPTVTRTKTYHQHEHHRDKFRHHRQLHIIYWTPESTAISNRYAMLLSVALYHRHSSMPTAH